MSNLTNKKKTPWRQISIIVFILVVIGGIYMMKNASAYNEDNAAVQNEFTEQTLTADQNSQQTSGSLPKLVDLGSDTCIPCQEMAPILEELKEEYAGKIDVEVVDVYEDEEIAMEYNAIHPLSVIPTQILFDANGNEVWSHEGSLAKEDIIKVFQDKLGVE